MVAIHAPLLRGYVLVRLSKSHTSPSPLSRCILNGITCTSIMDNAPTCPVCQAELIPKVSGSATPNFDRAILACPNDKPDNRHQGAFKWTEPPKHVPHDWPSCLCGVLAQIKKWGTTYSFKCWDESPSNVSSHAAQPQFRTSSIVIVLHAVGCTRQKAQLNVCPYHLRQHRHLPWIQHHRAKFHGQIPRHQLKVISALKT